MLAERLQFPQKRSTLNAANNAGDASRDKLRDNPNMPSNEPSHELISALAGHDASREAAVGYHTRRVVLSSLGVLREQKQSRSRARGVALSFVLIVPLLIAPLVWEATDSFIAGEHLGDPGSQLSLWATVFCCTLLAAVLVAGWWKKRA